MVDIFDYFHILQNEQSLTQIENNYKETNTGS